MKKVKSITYNWHQVGSVTDRDGSGEDFEKFEIGSKGVKEIIENEPRNGMQLWNFEVIFNDGTSCRVFNPNFVQYFKPDW